MRWWIVVLLALLGGCGGGGGDALARVRARGVLRWGGDVQGGEPYVYQDGSRLTGFEVELADAIAREMGLRAEFVQNDWSALVPSLERDTFDIAMNGVEVTPSRVGRVAFTRPYYVFAERLMVRRDAPPTPATMEALRGRRVGTLSNTLAFERLQGLATVVPYEGTREPYVDLGQGRTDAVLLDNIIAARYGEPDPALRVVGDLFEGHYAIAVRPGDAALLRAVDDALGRVVARGELRAILTRWSLWDGRQERLARWSPDDQRAMLGPAHAAPTLGARHLALFLRGAGVTLLVSALAMALAIPLGMGLAVARLYGPRGVGALATAYVEVFRGTPVLLQLYVLYYGLASVIRLDAFTAAVIGLGLNYGAYEGEVYRAGIQAVPKGQMEAALSLGMSTPLALRRVVLPQAFRLALPSVTNDFIALLKDSSLVSVITVVELTKQMTITAVDVRAWLPPGALCALMYFLMSYPLSLLARRLEARLARQ